MWRLHSKHILPISGILQGLFRMLKRFKNQETRVKNQESRAGMVRMYKKNQEPGIKSQEPGKGACNRILALGSWFLILES